MKITVVGTGRLGRILVEKLAPFHNVAIYDRNEKVTNELAQKLKVEIINNLEDVINSEMIILAVPDMEVIKCIKYFNLTEKETIIVNVATNVSQHALDMTAHKHLKCISVKFVSNAAEMSEGRRPVIIVNNRPAELSEKMAEVFSAVGEVIIGNADIVNAINRAAAEKILEAGVHIIEHLERLGVNDQRIIQSALGQVAAGTLKAFAHDDLGPFAKDIVRKVNAKLKNQS